MALMTNFQLEQVSNLLDQIDPEQVVRNSFRDYHAKGLDYVCLHRSDGLTIKAYFLNVPVGVNVVNPHDHAYNFHTFVLKGKLKNLIYTHNSGPIVNQWKYLPPTPWVDHKFKFEKPVKLGVAQDHEYCVGTGYYMTREEIHTIQALAPDTVMLLFQYKTPDEKKRGGTYLYTKEDSPPSVYGLYNRFSEQEIETRVKQLRDLVR